MKTKRNVRMRLSDVINRCLKAAGFEEEKFVSYKDNEHAHVTHVNLPEERFWVDHIVSCAVHSICERYPLDYFGNEPQERYALAYSELQRIISEIE